MRLTFTFAARVTDSDSGIEVMPPESLDNWQPTDDLLENHLDANLVDAGVVGGKLRVLIRDKKALLQAIYWIPNSEADVLAERVRADTIAQLDDGIGEGGFAFNADDEQLIVTADTETSVGIEITDDGETVPTPSAIAIAARDGNLPSLASAIANDAAGIDKRHQNYSGLHLAILYGHPEAVRMLLAAGADPNLVEPQGSTPLQLCALSNSLDDQQSWQVAKMLLDAGANASNVASNGETAKSYAELRKKHRTAELL